MEESEKSTPDSGPLSGPDENAPNALLGSINDLPGSDQSQPSATDDQSEPASPMAPLAAEMTIDGQAMEALLAMGSSAPATDPESPSADLAVIDEAMADAGNEQFVDSLVDHFAADTVIVPSIDSIAGLLATMVGGDAAPMQTPFDFNQIADDLHLAGVA